MNAITTPRVVLVTRPTEYQALLVRHGTADQARFFLKSRGQPFEAVEARHQRAEGALHTVSQAIPLKWRRSHIDREDLARFVFEPDDLIVAVGQDGLVANVSKYLSGQPVIGVNPDPEQNEGVLVPHRPRDVAALLHSAAEGRCTVQHRSLVSAQLDDGQRLIALNEIFIGHRSHQSARYRLQLDDREERQSSSGLIVATGTGASGWARLIERERKQPPPLPMPEEPAVVFFVREAHPSVSTGAELTAGQLGADARLRVISEMNEGGVVFGDGIEDDRLELGWGMTTTLSVASEQLRLVVG